MDSSKLTTSLPMESTSRPSPPAMPAAGSPEQPHSPVVHRMTLSETLALPPPSPSPPPPHSHLWEEMGMPAPSPPPFINRTPTTPPAKADAAADGGGERRSKVVLGILRRSKREAMVRKAEVGLRICGLVFCLVSFSVMVADRTQGWAGDSFDRYLEYRYCVAMAVIGFTYSSFQLYQFIHSIVFGKFIIPLPYRRLFNFGMDQVLAYLLMSASSSAATRTDDWVTNWGQDEFTKIATGSIGMSFLAFSSLALSSLISGYNLLDRR